MQRPFTVLIIGSSPAALALALALTQQKIAFTLLTRASSLIPAEQPPITLHPHAVAILDQLDVWRKIKDDAVEISNPLWARLGYPLVILQERRLREALCGGIPLSGIHTKKKVVDTRADERGVTVITGDMEVFSADIIVDFDSIWEEFSQGEFASYWGIAQTTGRSFITEKGITCLTAAGCWWAVLKIPPPVTASNARALEILEKFRQGEEEPEMVLEGVARKWSEERILLMGDGAWQLSPLSYLSTSLALESVAAFMNSFEISSNNVDMIIRSYEQTHRPRVELCSKISRVLTRTATRHSRWYAFLARWAVHRTPVLLYEEFALGATVLRRRFPGEGIFWKLYERGGLVKRTKVLTTGVGLWTGTQIEMLKFQVRRCAPIYEQVMAEIEVRLPVVEHGLIRTKALIAERPLLQISLGVVGACTGFYFLSKCGGWIVRVLDTAVKGRTIRSRSVVKRVGVYCIPGSNFTLSY